MDTNADVYIHIYLTGQRTNQPTSQPAFSHTRKDSKLITGINQTPLDGLLTSLRCWEHRLNMSI